MFRIGPFRGLVWIAGLAACSDSTQPDAGPKLSAAWHTSFGSGLIHGGSAVVLLIEDSTPALAVQAYFEPEAYPTLVGRGTATADSVTFSLGRDVRETGITIQVMARRITPDSVAGRAVVGYPVGEQGLVYLTNTFSASRFPRAPTALVGRWAEVVYDINGTFGPPAVADTIRLLADGRAQRRTGTSFCVYTTDGSYRATSSSVALSLPSPMNPPCLPYPVPTKLQFDGTRLSRTDTLDYGIVKQVWLKR